MTTETPFAQDFSLASLGAFMWIQPALGCAATSGTGAEAFGSFQTWLDSTGAIVAKQTIELSPDVNATKTAFRVLGKPFPALGLTGVMIAVAARGVSGSPTMNFVTRTFTGDPSTPSAWGTPLLGTDKTYASLNEDYNTGNLAVTPGTVSLVQLGLKLPATTDGYGRFDIMVAAKY